MAKRNCNCHKIGSMSKTRRSSNKSALQTVGGITAGIAVGALGVPKIVSTIDPEGKIDPKIINGVGAVGAFMLAKKQKGFVQSMLHGLAGGLAWNVISNVAGMAGMGYVDDNSTKYLNQVAGDYFPSRMDAGTV